MTDFCRNGHECNDANTYVFRGQAQCRACNREAARRCRAKRPPLPMGRRPIPVEQRFWLKVERRSGNECWTWCAGVNRRGYGRICLPNGKSVGAHRVSWELTNGPIPNGLQVLHRCDNPPCVNPSHLWLGTHTDNMRDMAAKGRAALSRKRRAR